MSRKELIGLIRREAEKCGYTFYTGFEYRIAAETKNYPALWLLPPRLIKKEGRREGVKHYEIEIRMLDLARDNNGQMKEDLFSGMENDASHICLGIGAGGDVRTLSGVNYQPEEKPSTPHGDISLSLKFALQADYSETDCRE